MEHRASESETIVRFPVVGAGETSLVQISYYENGNNFLTLAPKGINEDFCNYEEFEKYVNKLGNLTARLVLPQVQKVEGSVSFSEHFKDSSYELALATVFICYYCKLNIPANVIVATGEIEQDSSHANGDICAIRNLKEKIVHAANSDSKTQLFIFPKSNLVERETSEADKYTVAELKNAAKGAFECIPVSSLDELKEILISKFSGEFDSEIARSTSYIGDLLKPLWDKKQIVIYISVILVAAFFLYKYTNATKQENDLNSPIAGTERILNEKALAEQRRKEEEAKALAEQRRKEEEAKALAEQRRKEEEAKALAEQRRKEEEAKALAEQRRKEEEAKAQAEQRRKEEEAKALAEQRRKEEEAKALAEQRRKEEEAKALAEQRRKEEEAKALAEQRRKEEMPGYGGKGADDNFRLILENMGITQ